MAGLFSLLFGTAIAVSGIKHTVNNSWCKQNLRKKLPNGIEYYTDTDGKDRLMDGSLLIWYGYGNNEKVVKLPNREVIYDAKGNRDKQAVNGVERLNKKFESLPIYIDVSGYFFHRDWDMNCNYGFYEKSTKKELAKLEVRLNDGNPIYIKRYGHKRVFPDGSYGGVLEDEILITKEEWEKLSDAKKQINKEAFSNYNISLPILL